MKTYSYEAAAEGPAPLGLVALQTDETIEHDLARLLPGARLFVSRVPNGLEVTPETLQAMAAEISGASGLLPGSRTFDAIAYGCTSGSAQIGPDEVARLVRAGQDTRAVTDPVSALSAACAHLGIKRLAFLSPYIEEVSGTLRAVLAHGGVETPVFGSFEEGDDSKVVRISASSIKAAATDLCTGEDVDGLFLSCTNLRTLEVIEPLEAALGLPVLSSNLVLAWHLARLSGTRTAGFGRLFSQG